MTVTQPFASSVIAHYVDDIVTGSDDDICAAMAIYQEEAKLAVEPAAAAALAGAIGPLRQWIVENALASLFVRRTSIAVKITTASGKFDIEILNARTKR